MDIVLITVNMKLLLLAAFVSASSAAPYLAPAVPVQTIGEHSYIIGGSEAAIGQFPFQGNLLFTSDPASSHVCGAVYIGGAWALSVAHCTESAWVFRVY